jgi:hypothetical protein
MSSNREEDIPVEEVTQDIHEQQLVTRFDFLAFQNGPQRGAVVLRFLGFGVVRLVGIDPDEARAGDIAVEVAHNGFYTRAQVWLKVTDGEGGWTPTLELQTQFYHTSYLA